MCKKSQQGQQVMEYLILVVVVIIVLIVFLKPGGFFATGVDSIIDGTLNQINYEATQIN